MEGEELHLDFHARDGCDVDYSGKENKGIHLDCLNHSGVEGLNTQLREEGLVVRH